jgi:hypothetical protein
MLIATGWLSFIMAGIAVVAENVIRGGCVGVLGAMNC